jgi:ribosomal protein S4
LYLKGAKCDSPKCPIELRPYPPGVHGRARTKDSEYLLQMREKQKAARIYGVLEKQFRGYYQEAHRRPGKTGENLLRILETRKNWQERKLRMNARKACTARDGPHPGELIFLRPDTGTAT